MQQVTLKGAFSSPYTLKMRAVLRYRRIPYRWVLRGSQWDDLPEAPVPVIPTPTAVAVERAPRVVNWIQRVDDLGWWEVDGDAGWSRIAELPDTVHRLLREAGETYAPFMLANAAALEAGEDEVVCEVRGAEYRQAPFKYQGKCLAWLREARADLDDADRKAVDEALAGTGCEQLFP